MALTRLGLNQSINLASNVTGTLATGNGGTGATSFAPGKLVQVKRANITYTGGGTASSYGGLATNTITNPGGTEIKITGFSATAGNILVCSWQYGGGGGTSNGLNHSFGVNFGGNVELAYSGYWNTGYTPNNIGCTVSHVLTGNLSNAEIKAVIQTEENKTFEIYGDYTVAGSAQGHIVCTEMEA